MPILYTDDYQVADWSSGNFTGPLTGGSADFFYSTGVVFTPSGETGGTGVNTWIDGLGANQLTVNVSCQTPNTSSTAGWVGLVDETFTAIVGQSTDMSGGGTKTVVLDTSSVDWTTVRGLQVKSGDSAAEHEFTLHSTSFTSPSAALTVSGKVPLGGSATLFEACILSASGSVSLGGSADILAEWILSASGAIPLGGAASIVRTPIFSVRDGYFLGGGATFDTPVAMFIASRFALGGSASLTTESALTVSGSVPLYGAADFYNEPVFNASGKVKFGGSATLFESAMLSASGRVRFGGTGVFNVGNKFAATGKVGLGGAATFYAGRTLSCSGKVALYGAAQFKHAVAVSAQGAVTFGGLVEFWHAAPRTLSVAGAVPLSGYASFDQQRFDSIDIEAYVTTRKNEVVAHG